MKCISILFRLAFGVGRQARFRALTPVMVVILLHGCGAAGRQEHEAGGTLARSLKNHVCSTEIKDFTSPCGAIDVRYRASPDALFLNVYGVNAPNQIAELVARVRHDRAEKAIRFKVTVNFYRNIDSHSLIHSEIIGG